MQLLGCVIVLCLDFLKSVKLFLSLNHFTLPPAIYELSSLSDVAIIFLFWAPL